MHQVRYTCTCMHGQSEHLNMHAHHDVTCFIKIKIQPYAFASPYWDIGLHVGM